MKYQHTSYKTSPNKLILFWYFHDTQQAGSSVSVGGANTPRMTESEGEVQLFSTDSLRALEHGQV